jgi:hypothetical protein
MTGTRDELRDGPPDGRRDGHPEGRVDGHPNGRRDDHPDGRVTVTGPTSPVGPPAPVQRPVPVTAPARAPTETPRVTACAFTGRLGMWTELREHRPQPPVQRHLLPSDRATCPFCVFADQDPRLLPDEAIRDGQRWFGVHNIFPPIDGPTGRADLAVATAHDPTLTRLHDGLVSDWATMLELQQRLAGRRLDRWSMCPTAVGRTAGASQHHPHGHVLTPAILPPATVRRQRRLQDPAVPAALLADAITVAADTGVRLTAPPVPLGPLDLMLVPERAQRFRAVDPEIVARQVVVWIRAVHALVDPEPGVPATVAPFDAKVVLHPELPDGTGRWWGELTVTDRHAPGVAAVPLVDVRYPPEVHARRFREATT